MPMDGLRQVENMARRHSKTIPTLTQYQEFTYYEGYPCYTPDELPLVGPVPSVEGLYVMTGDSETGITHGPGLGRELARVIAGRQPEIDIDRYRPDRFGSRWPTPREVVDEIRTRRPQFEHIVV
jgi:sarcosine oxidase subunit beta